MQGSGERESWMVWLLDSIPAGSLAANDWDFAKGRNVVLTLTGAATNTNPLARFRARAASAAAGGAGFSGVNSGGSNNNSGGCSLFLHEPGSCSTQLSAGGGCVSGEGLVGKVEQVSAANVKPTSDSQRYFAISIDGGSVLGIGFPRREESAAFQESMKKYGVVTDEKEKACNSGKLAAVPLAAGPKKSESMDVLPRVRGKTSGGGNGGIRGRPPAPMVMASSGRGARLLPATPAAAGNAAKPRPPSSDYEQAGGATNSQAELRPPSPLVVKRPTLRKQGESSNENGTGASRGRGNAAPSAEALEVSRKYFEGPLSEKEKLHDGFYDAFHQSSRTRTLPSLQELQKAAVDLDTREVVVVDRRTDKRLQRILKTAQLLCQKFPTLGTKIRLLAMHVSNAMGGSHQFAASPSSGEEEAEEEYTDTERFRLSCVDCIKRLKQERGSNIIPLGSITHGLSRHRTLLFKYLCDNMNPPIPCCLMRLNTEKNTDCIDDRVLLECWNLVPWKDKFRWVDVVCDPGRMYIANSEKLRVYHQSWHGELFLSDRTKEANRHIFSNFDLQTGEMVLRKQLGEGAYSKVYLCSVGPISCAVKIYDKPQNSEQMMKETLLQERLNHKNIVKCIGYETSPTQFLVFMEYMSAGSMWNLIYRRRMENKPFTNQEVAHYASEVAQGLSYLHSQNVYHRDIKSANVLVDGEYTKQPFPVVKLCDFNVSSRKQQTSTITGTPIYSAPEIVNGRGGHSYDAAKADIWSLGMFIVELVTLQLPYHGLSEQEKNSLIRSGELPPGLRNKCHPTVFNLIMNCCKKRPQERISAIDIVTLLNPLGVSS
ncbi:Protein kinase domain-containing protein [Balamuthia mandrillaris]